MSQARVEDPTHALAPSAARPVLGDFIEVVKPKHLLVLVTCWATMILAPVTPSASLVIVATIATGLAVAASHVFNQLIDRDVDAVMSRTRNRPIAAGRMSVRTAAIYGTSLAALSIVLMVWQVNLLSAALVLAGLFVYDVLYSYWLKRTSPWCTLVGGISGGIPALIGWSSLTDSLDAVPLILFAFMVLWQSPHFYALSLFKEEEYRKAGLPVLVVVRGKRVTLTRLIGYTFLLIVCTVLLYTTGAVGSVYLGIALTLGAVYLAVGIRASLGSDEELPKWGKRLFLLSYVYMFTIFITAVLNQTA